MEGYVRRKKYYVRWRWTERYLSLKEGSTTLLYFHRRDDPEPRRRLQLRPESVVVGPIRGSDSRWIFKLSRLSKGGGSQFDEEDLSEEEKEDQTTSTSPQQPRRGIFRRRGSQKNLVEHANAEHVSSDGGHAGTDGDMDKTTAATPQGAGSSAAPSPQNSGAFVMGSAFAGNDKRPSMAPSMAGIPGQGGSGKVKRVSTLTFSVRTRQEAQRWVSAIQRAITLALEEHQVSRSKRLKKRADFGAIPGHLEAFLKHDEVTHPLTKDKVVVHSIRNGLTIYREIGDWDHDDSRRRAMEVVSRPLVVGTVVFLVMAFFSGLFSLLAWTVSTLCAWFVLIRFVLKAKTPPPASFMAGKVIDANPQRVFDAIMDDGNFSAWDSNVVDCRVLESVDAHTDILYVRHRPVEILFNWLSLKPRDLVLRRYWCRDEDGAFHVILQSCSHPSAPVDTHCVRGNIAYTAFSISPPRTERFDDEGHLSCYVLRVVRYDAKGIHRFLRALGLFDLVFVAPLLDALVSLTHHISSLDYVVSVFHGGISGFDFDSASLETEDGTAAARHAELEAISAEEREAREAQQDSGRTSATDGDSPAGNSEIRVEDGMIVGVRRHPCSGHQEAIFEPAATKFMVRGPTYLSDSKKIPSEPAAFHLVGCDVFTFEQPKERYGAAARPGSLVQRVLSKCKNPDDPANFFFVVNIVLPTKANHCLLAYFQPSIPDWKTKDTRFWRLFRHYIDQETSDEYRNLRIKLLPDLVSAPFIMRNLLKTRPALIGTKKVQIQYHHGSNYFEQVIDVEADPHARFLTNMVLGAVRTVVVDLAFLIEAKEDEELPERVIGCVRFKKCNLNRNKYVRSGVSLAPDESAEHASMTNSMDA